MQANTEGNETGETIMNEFSKLWIMWIQGRSETDVIGRVGLGAAAGQLAYWPVTPSNWPADSPNTVNQRCTLYIGAEKTEKEGQIETRNPGSIVDQERAKKRSKVCLSEWRRRD